MRTNSFMALILLVGTIAVAGCTSVPENRGSADKGTSSSPVSSPLQKADQLIGNQKWAEARKVLQSFVATRPAEWRSKVETGDAVTITYWDPYHFDQCHSFDQDAALKTIHANIGDSYAKAYYYLAYIAVELNQFPAAHEALAHGLELEPDSATLLAEKGTLYQSEDSPGEAVKSFRAVIALKSCVTDDLYGKAYRGLGVSLIDLGELDEAEQALKTSLKYSPNNPNALHELQYLARMRQGKQQAQPLELSHPK